MDIFMARQPIFDIVRQVYAYELLYREDHRNAFSGNVDGNSATSYLVSDAISVFGLDNITNGNLAFINFTKDLIMGGMPKLLDPNAVIIEILEDTIVDEPFLEAVMELRRLGYRIALDDYVGEQHFDDLLPLVDIVKVDYLGTTKEEIRRIADMHRGKRILLAEKIETEADFQEAIAYGFTYFQGYYFSKPKLIQGKTLSLTASAYASIIVELGKLSPDFNSLTRVISNDPTLTYKLLQHAATTQFIQRERVTSVQMALVNMGLDAVRRWILLIIARNFTSDKQTELVKTSFIRAIFLEKVAMKSGALADRINEVFLMGVLSMLDAISGFGLDELLEQIPIADDIKRALKDEEENEFYDLLTFVRAYERGDWDTIDQNIEQYNFEKESISTIYLECVINAELVFGKRAATYQ